jgi:hypothetical protein
VCSGLDNIAPSRARACKVKSNIHYQVGNKTATARKLKVQVTVSPDGQAVQPVVEVRTVKLAVCSNVTCCSIMQALR